MHFDQSLCGSLPVLPVQPPKGGVPVPPRPRSRSPPRFPTCDLRPPPYTCTNLHLLAPTCWKKDFAGRAGHRIPNTSVNMVIWLMALDSGFDFGRRGWWRVGRGGQCAPFESSISANCQASKTQRIQLFSVGSFQTRGPELQARFNPVISVVRFQILSLEGIRSVIHLVLAVGQMDCSAALRTRSKLFGATPNAD
jgi:hypothetical protein